jgi:hypothetical protein
VQLTPALQVDLKLWLEKGWILSCDRKCQINWRALTLIMRAWQTEIQQYIDGQYEQINYNSIMLQKY